ncbi:recombinase : Resolvase protein (Fragment) OS=Rhodopirellula maiorica SM1 GN=RMSM_01145 PE=4 SV=1: Resolvase: Recombinase: Zn_ribbon_recom [Gemmataceae bacterium]
MAPTAVAYVRRSSDSVSQSDSIAEQTRELELFAAEKGYQIIRWYTDDAISGDDTDKRHEFRRMISDAQERRDFEFIICWDLARFGRFDSIEAGYYIFPLRKAGVRLVTKQDGVVDWNDPMGRLCNSMRQEGKHQQLLDHAANVVRGQRAAAETGSWLGSPPYAYRLDGPKKNKRLVLDDVTKVGVVQRIFREFVEEGRSMSNIAERLNEAGYPPPGSRGRPWRFDSVRIILENPAYVGDYASSRYSYGKYKTLVHGKASKAGTRTKNSEAEWIVRRDTHEPIINRDTFERAQAILLKGKNGRNGYTPEENPFVFNGLLRCGKCAGPMWGDRVPSKTGDRLSYECGNWQYHGEDHCKGTKVSEAVLLESLEQHLTEWVGCDPLEGARRVQLDAFADTDLPKAFHDIKRLVCPPTLPKHDRAQLQKRIDKLKADAAKARGNLALLDPEFIPDVTAQIRRMEAERAVLEKEFTESKPLPEKELNQIAWDVFSNLLGLTSSCRLLATTYPSTVDHPDSEIAAALGRALNPVPRQQMVRELRQFLGHVAHIVVHSTTTGTGRGTRHPFVKGELVLRVGGVTRELNPRFLVVIQVS